jgi:cytochrome c biogenesis protein CcmG/thiol:disulfide interchange protein DsbE
MAEELEGQQEQPPALTTRRWPVILVWVLVLGLLGVLGFGLIRTQQGPIGIGDKVPDLTLTTFEGDSIPLRDLQGQVVVINFWASWCKPCEQEALELEEAYQTYKETEAEALAYLDKFKITYPNGPDLGTRISQAFRIRGVPETYIAGVDGRLVTVKIGPYESLNEIIQQIELALAD